MIGAADTGYHGKKKKWIGAVWDVLHERYLENNLCEQIYEVESTEQDASTEPAGASTRPSPPSASSMQMFLNEPVAVGEINVCGDFPTSEPVEEAPMVELVPDVESLTEKQQETEDLESAMKRWVEQVESVRMLEDIDWLDKLPDEHENMAALNIIFRHGMTYCTKFLDGCLQPWNLSDWPLNPRVWLCEMERCLKTMRKKDWIPYWLKRPHDRNIRDDASASADGSTDPGNYVLDVVVHALRLWQYCESGRINMVMKQSIVEYGERANKSAHGPVNLRGNIVEAMQRNLQQMGSSPRRQEQEYDAVEYWWEWELKKQSIRNSRSEPQRYADRSSWGSSSSGAWQRQR